MGRILISSENSRLQNVFGYLLAAVILPFALIGALIWGIFGRPIERTADEVARYIRAMLDGTVNEEDSGYDYDEFSCVPIADPKLESLARRACEAFELRPESDRATLEGLLAEAEALAMKG
jgi:hypothetical protein